MLKILLMGPQGCGKGTIGEMLSEKYKLPLISVGQLARRITPSHPQYEETRKLLRAGKLISFEVLADIIIDRVALDDCKNGFILDGWARDIENLNFYNPGFDKVLYLTVSVETTIRRLSTRRTCTQCGAVFNILTVPPKVDGICDICGGKLIQRDDDAEQAIRERLAIFDSKTLPVVEYFRQEGNLVEVNAEAMPHEVFVDVVKALNIKSDNY